MTSIGHLSAAGARRTWLWRNEHGFTAPEASGPRRLLVDVSAIIRHDPQTGIQRVVRAVWSELKRRSGPAFEVVPVCATSRHGYRYAPLDFIAGNNADSVGECASVRPGDVFLGLDLSAHLLPMYRRQLRAWRVHGASINIVVYDLLPLLRPEWFNSRTNANFRKWYKVLRTEADRALCISDYVAGELRQRLDEDGASRPTVARMRLGADIAASLPSTGVSGELGRVLQKTKFRPAVLMVGTVEPRKGYDVALRAFEQLWSSRPAEAPDLIIVGRSGWKTEALQSEIRAHPHHGRRLHWLTGVSDEGLCRLYEACRGVFMPSRGEGFGLPLVEAAMAGRHVLARDLPVFREQGLGNVIYFDDDRREPLGRRIMDLVALPQEAPLAAAALPKWSDCVDELLVEIALEAAEVNHREAPLRKAS